MVSVQFLHDHPPLAFGPLLSARGTTQFQSAMSATSRIDVFEDDRGLRTCFEAANVLPEWRKPFMASHKVETLDDFVYFGGS